MECFLNPLDSFISWIHLVKKGGKKRKKAHRKCLGGTGVGPEPDWTDVVTVRAKPASRTRCRFTVGRGRANLFSGSKVDGRFLRLAAAPSADGTCEGRPGAGPQSLPGFVAAEGKLLDCGI